MYSLFRILFPIPKSCFRKYYVIEKYEKPCTCLSKCKYPPPDTSLKIEVHQPVASRRPLIDLQYP